jgi:hypothetical protein
LRRRVVGNDRGGGVTQGEIGIEARDHSLIGVFVRKCFSEEEEAAIFARN